MALVTFAACEALYHEPVFAESVPKTHRCHFESELPT